MKKNLELRRYAKERKVACWEIADQLGVHENTVLRWMRHELSTDMQRKLRDAIDAAAKAAREE